MSRRALCAILISASLITATPSLACSLRDVGPDNFWAATDVMPRMLYGQAHFVEVVEIDRAEPLAFAPEDAPDLVAAIKNASDEAARDKAQRRLDNWATSRDGLEIYRVRFRPVERLKGDGPEGFTLSALHHDRTPERVSAESSSIAERGDFSDPLTVFALNTVEAAQWGGGGSCSSPVETMTGQRYLVFRGKDGRLISGSIPAAIGWSLEETYLGAGPVFEPLSGDNDPWLLRVREAKAAEIRGLKGLKDRIEAEAR